MLVFDFDINDVLIRTVELRVFHRFPKLEQAMRRDSAGQMQRGATPRSPWKLALFARAEVRKDRRSRVFRRPGAEFE